MLRILALLFVLTACSKPTFNEQFQTKYKGDLDRIKAIRTPPPHLVNKVVISRAPGREEVMEAVRRGSGDAGKYNGVNQYGENQEFYRITRFDDSIKLPDDIFLVRYNNGQYQSFISRDILFDQIKIPNKDAYGVQAQLSQKNYLIINPKVMQDNIDQIAMNRDAKMVEHSKILIRERKDLRQKRQVEGIFGDLDDVLDQAFDLTANDS